MPAAGHGAGQFIKICDKKRRENKPSAYAVPGHNLTSLFITSRSTSILIRGMNETCPHCGKISSEESPRFCSGCGARMDGSIPAGLTGLAGLTGFAAPADEKKSPAAAGLCSSFIPGLGQVYNGEVAKGFLLFILTLVGLVVLVIPGLAVWIYAMYDAYAVAGKMNTGEIEYRETRMVWIAVFIIFAVFVVILAVTIIIAMLTATLISGLEPLCSGGSAMMQNPGGGF
jgi:TM2 domain-containing membrane protein YozV